MMDAIADELARSLVDRLQTIPPSRRLLVGLAGIPASGKSTLAALVVDRTNRILTAPDARASPTALEHTAGVRAVLVGLDGWHLPRSALDALPDPVLARSKRGAHWTFDGAAYAEFVKQLRRDVARPYAAIRSSWNADDPAQAGSAALIMAPSFDHAVKDPVENTVVIGPHHRVVVIEGLYAFLGIDPWKEASELLDERWLVELDEVEARQRLVRRHVLTGVASTLDEAFFRADDNDMPNGRFVLENILEPTRRIQSVDDPVLVAASR